MLQNVALKLPLLRSSAALQEQVRQKFILKRKYDPLLHKIGQRPQRLRSKNFIYELVEDTLIKKRMEMEVVLTTYVDGVGDKGDVVAKKPNFAYNKLLLPGLAVYKTEENIAKYAKTQEDKTEVLHSSPYAQITVNKLERLVLAVVMNKDHPWVIEPWHIRASLRKAGYYCPEDAITLPSEPIEGPDLKKENKEFICTITINNLEKAKLRCRIHHWSTDPSERLPYLVEHWKMPAEPLYGSDLTAETAGATKTD